MEKLMLSIISIMLLMSLVLSSCTDVENNTSDEKSQKEESSVMSINESSVDQTKEESDETTEEISQSTSEETTEEISENTEESSEESSEEESSEIPIEPQIEEINSISELRDFLNEAKNNNDFIVEFEYNANEMFSAEQIARMLSAFYIEYNYTDGHYVLEITEFPGDRIVDSFFGYSDVTLTPDEERALDEALAIVDAAVTNTENDYELELYIHDYLAENITYYSPSVDVPDKNTPPRHLTCIGAFLDGEANCQGYTDAFYVLASLAGFEVSRISVVDNFGGGHMLNTINLDDKWYLVDVTFDDVLYNTGDETNYRLFNASEDMCDEYGWSAEMEYNDITETTDSKYYYYGEKTFYDINEMADYITECYITEEETIFQLLLKGHDKNWEDLDEVLSNALNNAGASFEYTVWSYTTGKNTFYKVVFNL